MNKKILLLNPPGRRLYIRDYYCSKVSQANYIYPPTDLVYISGYLKNFDLYFIDAVVKKLSVDYVFKKIGEINPDYIISLIGAVSLQEDIEFIKKIKLYNEKMKIVVSGDIFKEEPQQQLKKYPYIDAVLTDFFSEGVLYYILSDYEKIVDVVYRIDGEIVSKETKCKVVKDIELPIPKHELFVFLPYRYPFIYSRYFAVVLAGYGCPFNCAFCIIGKLGYKLRKIENVIAELKYVRSIGIKEVFFLDQTFFANKNYYKLLCENMIKENLNLAWICFSRVDVVDEEILLLMKSAGCHTIIFGVESGDEKILEKYRKGYTLQQVKKIIEFCNKINIQTVGTFILGLPEETKQSMQKTLKLITSIPLDFVSLNVAVPRRGTDLRKEAITLGLINENFDIMDQSGTEIAMSTKTLSKQDILNFRRKMVIKFYFRLKYIVNKLKKIKNLKDLIKKINQALFLIKNTFF